MVFNEVYSCYYNAVAKMLSLAVDGRLTTAKMNEIVLENAFEESALTIIPALQKQEWQLLTSENETPIIYKPQMPMTNLERRWLKTILLDPRIALFDIPTGDLKDVEPLFSREDIVYFDRYLDGDPFDDPYYIANFHKITQAIKNKQVIMVRFISGKGRERLHKLEPIKLEYSDKEDKFRVLCAGRSDIRTINLGRIIKCTVLEATFPKETILNSRNKERLTFVLTDERNALERAMMQFAHFKKEVEKIGENRYQVEMEYDIYDETDVVIQIMSFGRYVKVIGPDRIKQDICKRLKKQMKMLQW